MHPRTILGVSSESYCRPLIEPFLEGDLFEIVRDAPASLARRLGSRSLNAAFLSPIDYAQNASEYYIVPGVAVSSCSANDALVIHFRKAVRSIRTLAVHLTSASDIILAKVLLAERFDVQPSIVPVAGSLDEMLAKADAALLAGDMALRGAQAHPGALDLVEEWSIATDLPYVHGFWCGREKTLTEEEWQMLARAASGARRTQEIHGSDQGSILDRFTYEFDENVQEGVREFLRYAFYHGILPDVPDLRFYGTLDSAPTDAPGLN